MSRRHTEQKLVDVVVLVDAVKMFAMPIPRTDAESYIQPANHRRVGEEDDQNSEQLRKVALPKNLIARLSRAGSRWRTRF